MSSAPSGNLSPEESAVTVERSGGVHIGIDLGGTKIEGLVLSEGRELGRVRVRTPGDYSGIIEAVSEVVVGLESTVGRRGTVGVGTPGALVPDREVLRNSNTACLNGRSLQADLEAALGRPVRLANDADCFALSEATDGAGAGADSVFGVIAGTGTGGGVVVHGRLLRGPNGLTGEWGHTPLPWPTADETPGPRCYCGKRGCIETWLSGPGLAADHERVTGERLDAAEIGARGAAGDEAARATLDRHVDRFARALSVVIDVLDPYVVVLGGGVSKLAHLYEAIPERWGRYVFDSSGRAEVRTVLRRARHGDSSGVRGAAWLWEDQLPS